MILSSQNYLHRSLCFICFLTLFSETKITAFSVLFFFMAFVTTWHYIGHVFICFLYPPPHYNKSSIISGPLPVLFIAACLGFQSRLPKFITDMTFHILTNVWMCVFSMDHRVLVLERTSGMNQPNTLVFRKTAWGPERWNVFEFTRWLGVSLDWVEGLHDVLRRTLTENHKFPV